MGSIRRIGLWLSSYLFRFCLYSAIVATSLIAIVSNSSYIKTALTSSQAYDRFVQTVIDTNTSEAQKTGSSIPFGNQNVQNIIKGSFPATDLQSATENIIDSVSKWLKGQTSKVDFSLDFSANKQQLATNLSIFAFGRLAEQPLCRTTPAELDPFTASCRPRNFNFNKETINFANELKSSSTFLPTTVLTAADLPKDLSGKNVFEKYSSAPRYYTYLKLAPIVFGVATLMLAGLIIALHKHKRQAMFDIGMGTLLSGVVLVVTPVVFGLALPHLTQSFQSQLSGSGQQAIFNDILNSINTSFNNILINISLQIVVIGMIILMIDRLSRPRSVYHKILKRSGLQSSHLVARVLSPERGYANWPVVSSEFDPAHPADKTTTETAKYRTIPSKEL